MSTYLTLIPGWASSKAGISTLFSASCWVELPPLPYEPQKVMVTGLSAVPSPSPPPAEQPTAAIPTAAAIATADPSFVKRFIAITPDVIDAPHGLSVLRREWCLGLFLPQN